MSYIGNKDLLTNKAEEIVLSVVEELSEAAYEKFTAGESTQPEFQETNERLRNWTREGAKLLTNLYGQRFVGQM